MNSKGSSEEFENKVFWCYELWVLTVPSTDLSDFVSSSFAILDYAKDHFDNNLVQHTAELLLKKYAPKSYLPVTNTLKKGLSLPLETVVNIFYNSKQKICRDDVRKDAVEVSRRNNVVKSKDLP